MNLFVVYRCQHCRLKKCLLMGMKSDCKFIFNIYCILSITSKTFCPYSFPTFIFNFLTCLCPPGFKKKFWIFSNLFFYLLLLTAPRVAAVQAERRPLPRAATMPQPILSRPINHHLPNPTPRIPGAQTNLPFQSRDSPNRWQVGRLYLIFNWINVNVNDDKDLNVFQCCYLKENAIEDY